MKMRGIRLGDEQDAHLRRLRGEEEQQKMDERRSEAVSGERPVCKNVANGASQQTRLVVRGPTHSDGHYFLGVRSQ